MGNADLLLDVPMVESVVEESPASPRRGVRARLGGLARRVGSGAGWLFGLVSLVLGLAVLASTPILQFLSLGYLLESSGRVARTGRLRDGVFGVRLAGRVGGMAVGTLISMIPLWLVGSYANSAAVIDPGGRWSGAGGSRRSPCGG